MLQNGLLSIVILSWNHEKYVKQCIDSVINQTYKNIEIIFIDNASTDNTFQTAIHLLESSNVQFFAKQFDSNLGICKAFNYAIQNLCSGEFIGIMSGDDWLENSNYAKKINYHTLHPSYKIIYSNGYAYYEDKDELDILSNRTECKEGNIFNDLLRVNFLFTQGVLIKKEVYDKIGYYNELSSVEDWDFSLRAAKNFEIGYINEPLFYWRRHSQSYSYGLRPEKFYEDVLSTINQYKMYPEYKDGVKWAAFDYLITKMWPLFSLNSWFYMKQYPFLVIPMLRRKSIDTPFLKQVWSILKPLKGIVKKL